MKNKVLLVLWGETFRSGPQLSRTRGKNDYLIRQQIASKSHINLMNKFKSNNYDTDIFINTYKLNENDDNILLNFYKKYGNVIKYNFHSTLFREEAKMLNNTYDNSHELLINYTHVLFIRIDLYLKKFLINNSIELLLNNKIIFPHINSNINLTDNKYFHICQQMMSFPQKYYNLITDKIIYNACHEIRDNLIKYGVSLDDIGYCINSLHICSTDFGWNPLYIQVGRENNNTYSINNSCLHIEYFYDTNTHTFIKSDTYNPTEYYKPYLLTDTLEEQFKTILNI